MMKKILFAIALLMVLSFGASAQSDGFFRSTDEGGYSNREASFVLPNAHGETGDQSATVPVGSGLLILTAMGAGYAIAGRKR